ncbi:MAG: DegT/DnrJ/EryC1/StrS family aminotransferase [Planctomycetes bacterium]|nr:DegT/DnrJ/EryC1/StrS family aminotransferase [Planctomycetota bacterium]
MSTLAIRGGTPVYTGAWPSWPVHDEREVERAVRVVRSGRWSWNGAEESEFRLAFGNFLGAKHGLCVTNGTHALQLALEALDVGGGDEVIVPGMTWQATAACALDINAVPILVDIEPETLCIDPDAVRAAITPRTKAIIPVHLYGCVANMDEILAIGREHNIPVIEDCSHQHGSEWRGRRVGSMGVLGCFSLQASKVLNSGEGGFISTSDTKLFERLESLRNCGRHTWSAASGSECSVPQSGNFRFNELQAALLNAQLARLPEQTIRRDENGQILNGLLPKIAGVKPLLRRELVTRQAYYAYSFRVDREAFAGLTRDRICRALQAELNLAFGGTYESLNRCSLYRPHTKRRYRISEEHWNKIDPARFKLPECERAMEEIVMIPQTALLAGKQEMERLAEGIAKVQRNAEELVGYEAQAAAGA